PGSGGLLLSVRVNASISQSLSGPYCHTAGWRSQLSSLAATVAEPSSGSIDAVCYTNYHCTYWRSKFMLDGKIKTHTSLDPLSFVFISTMDSVPWGGSEELWSQAALKLVSKGF